jgi:rRNA maturation protein Nop10
MVNSYNIISATPGCIGSTLSLSSTVQTGGTATHLWQAPNGTTFNTSSFTIANAQVADAGTYTYTVISPSCGSNTRTVRYVINDPNLITATNSGPICRGASANFNATGVTGTTYSWLGPAGFASSSQFPTRTNVQLSHAGDYTLNATVPGCGVITRTTTLVVNSCRTAENSSPDGIAETDGAEYSEIDPVINKENKEKLSNLKVYPNPFHEELSLSWSDMKVFSVKLFDLNGKVLYEAEPGQDGVEFTVKITDLPNGVYLLTVQTSAGPVSYRVTRF